MNLAVWGTGEYYQLYKKEIGAADIQILIDNDKDKQGLTLDGKEICAPNMVDYTKYDYVVILINAYETVMNQLVELGVSREKIIPYINLSFITRKKVTVVVGEKEIGLSDWIQKEHSKKVLITSHDLSRSGVPIALMNLAVLLKKMNYAVLYMSLKDGSLQEELQKKRIPYMKEPYVCGEEFLKYISQFDLYIMGTAAVANAVPFFLRYKKPIMWWIHEIDDYFVPKLVPFKEEKNITFFCGGEKARKAVEDYCGIEDVGELLYYVPEKGFVQRNVDEKIKFAVIGSISERKAQDIVIEALSMLPASYKGSYEIDIVGVCLEKEKTDYYMNLFKEHSEICYIGEMSENELEKYYSRIEVLVCPSREDTMPIVVTQAMQFGIPCLVSDHVGQAEFIEHEKNGLIFESENIQALSDNIQWILNNREKLKKIGQEGKKIFKEYFSEEQMSQKMKVILNELIG